MTTGKTIALTRWTFVGKVMSLLFNMLSRLVITFLPRSKCLLISWLQSPSPVIFGAPKNKVCHCFLTFGLINDMQTLDQAVSAVLFLDCCYWDAARWICGVRSLWGRNLDMMGSSPMRASGLRGYCVFWGNLCGFFKAVVTDVAFSAFPGISLVPDQWVDLLKPAWPGGIFDIFIS